MKTKTLIGGIYRDDNNELDYDGCYALTMGNDMFYFLFEGIDHIETEVEIACAHKMKLMDGYGLAVKKTNGSKYFNEWEIRNSGLKHTDKYIIASGNCGTYFNESLKQFKKIFSK